MKPNFITDKHNGGRLLDQNTDKIKLKKDSNFIIYNPNPKFIYLDLPISEFVLFCCFPFLFFVLSNDVTSTLSTKQKEKEKHRIKQTKESLYKSIHKKQKNKETNKQKKRS